LQLGDIVEFDYESENGFDQISEAGNRFVVYHIEYNRSLEEIGMSVFLSEVSEA
jgi:hypothetical protein